MADFGLTGIRLQQFNQLPQYANDGAGQANRRYQIMLLQRKQRASDKAIAKRNELRVAREELDKIYARELKKQADIEAKRLRDIRIERDLALARAKREEINRKARERRVKSKKSNMVIQSTASEKAKIKKRDIENSHLIMIGEDPNPYDPFRLYEDMLPKLKLVEGMLLSADLLDGNNVINSYQFDIQGLSQAENDICYHYNYSDSMKNYMAKKVMKSTHFRISVFQPIVATSKPQSFRDGKVHCVFNAIEEYYEQLLNEAKSDKTRANRQSIINKCKTLAIQYDNGVPEDKIDEVAKMLDVGIVVRNVSTHELIRGNKNAKNKSFEYINSRMNHLENITFDMNKSATPITIEEGQQLIMKCLNEFLWNIYTGTITNPKLITTANKRYIVGDPLTDTLYNFTSSFDRGFSIDYIKNKELCDFIMKGAHLMINYKNDKCKGKPKSEIDMKRAYTQFKKCPQYIGFPAIINEVRYTLPDHDVVTHPGIYQIKINSFTEEKYMGYGSVYNNGVAVLTELTRDADNRMQLLRDYGFVEGRNYILTSPWIVQLKECGVDITIIKGAWGKRFDFDFPEEMINEKLYAIWAGMQLSRSDDSHIKMACEREFAEIIASQHEVENFSYNEPCKTLSITKKKDYHYIMPHVSSFLVSYTQLSVFAEACKYPHDMVYAHKLDSIVLTCEPESFDESLWQLADERNQDIRINKASQPYIFNNESVNYDIFGSTVSYVPDTRGNLFISGMGGSGKTEIILKDKGYCNKLFVSTSWELIVDKMTDYKVKGVSVNQLLGYDIYNKKVPSYKDKHGSPNTIVHDEYSMSNLETLEKTIALYPYSTIICLGDYDGMYYQSSIINADKPLYHPTKYTILENDYRSLNQETKKFKADIRTIMSNGGSLLQYIYENVPCIDDIVKTYDKDFVLTYSHERIAYFTKLLQQEGKDHHKVMNHTYIDVLKKCNGGKALLHGEILDEAVHNRTEITHGFTVHSFQGKTIPIHKKAFIDITSFKCNQDIYTAISRVRCLSQLFLIKRNYKSVSFSDNYYSFTF